MPVGPFVLGMVALFRPRKGPEVLLDAIAEVRERGHDVRLQAVGPFENHDYEVELSDRVRKLNLQEAVHWTGFRHDVSDEMSRFDALVLPSLFGEGMPMVILEAMAHGLPVIATRCEGDHRSSHSPANWHGCRVGERPTTGRRDRRTSYWRTIVR